LEQLSYRGLIDLFYADESRVSLEPCVPYGWQFRDEEVFMPAGKGVGPEGAVNCFALLSRGNRCRFATTHGRVDSAFVIEQLEQLSLNLERVTVVVLDNAPTHRAQKVQQQRPFWEARGWEARGLFLFFLPPYSPHLNLAETLWRKLKHEWLQPADYLEPQNLFYRVRLALAAVGTHLLIHFKPFQYGLK